jgi:hypothetical protein
VVRIVSGARQRGALPCAFSMVHGKKKAFGKKKKVCRALFLYRMTNIFPY